MVIFHCYVSLPEGTTIISKHDVMFHHAGKGKQDVALFKEAASIFHHNDLRTFPLCQRDELTPAGGSVNVCRNQVDIQWQSHGCISQLKLAMDKTELMNRWTSPELV